MGEHIYLESTCIGEHIYLESTYTRDHIYQRPHIPEGTYIGKHVYQRGPETTRDDIREKSFKHTCQRTTSKCIRFELGLIFGA
jgi:hypothetical protein